MNVPFLPPEATTGAHAVDLLYVVLTLMSAAAFLAVFVPMIWFAFRYRKGHRADRKPTGVSEMKVELTWTILPFFIFVGVFVWGAVVYYDIEVPPEDVLRIDVIGKQWMWKILHENGQREINELHVPAGREVRLTLSSEDVIHSFYVPAFRIKQDAVPGRYTSLWFKPTVPGDYRLFCAEFCGTDHSRMIGTVHVMRPDAYEEWLASGSEGESIVRGGERLFRSNGCSGCHGGSTVVRAPPLEGVYGSDVPLADGSIVRADERYLRDSILQPESQVVAGYDPVMPSFQGVVSEEELLQLVEYIKSLGSQESGEETP